MQNDLAPVWHAIVFLLIGGASATLAMFVLHLIRRNRSPSKTAAPEAQECVAGDKDGKRSGGNPPVKEEVEQKFSERLALLSEVTNELSKGKTPDELHRRVVELGREKLDLDRIALLFISRDRQSMHGSFGVDTNGAITDEREACFPIEPTSRIRRIVLGEKLILRYTDVPLYLNGREIGRGMRILAGLWDGERVIGFMSIDNLLRKRPFTDRDEEFIRMFAITVGHLCSMKTSEKERENLQTQLLHAQKMESVGRLAGNMAHDFNNMLSVIIGFAELAANKLEPDHPLRTDLDTICKAAQRSASLTKQLLTFARKQVANPLSMDLNVTVTELLKMLSLLLGPEIKVNWQPGPDLWKVLFDPIQLDQLLANLCVNARDAIAGHGSIGIKTENVILDDTFCERSDICAPGEYVLLSVADDGCGMSEAVKSRLFEPFFTTKEPGSGTGLGLATVYGIVRQNKGIIRVESLPGSGTTFFIYLPRLSDAKPPR
jgi:signal transduction histidine kinase